MFVAGGGGYAIHGLVCTPSLTAKSLKKANSLLPTTFTATNAAGKACGVKKGKP